MKTLVLAAVLATGCTTLRDRADDAMSRGDYVAAAAMYDQVLAGSPNDQDALAKRARARDSALRVDLVAVQNLRAAGKTDAALDRLRVLLVRRDGWGGQMPAVLGPSLAIEITAASNWIGAEVGVKSDMDGPLAGEADEARYRELLSHRDFASARDAMAARLHEVGAAHCEALPATTPYAAWLAAKYCGHFSVARAVPALPDHRSALAVDGAIAGATAAESERARFALADAFKKSAWFAPSAPARAHATLDGHLAVSYSSQNVTLTAAWTESVPYTAYEESQESYEEPYEDTETYWEDVPSTEYKTETVPCGDTTCTNTVPETVYHSEMKTRTVTKYRTQWRTVTNPVTRYRDEQRSQDYQATERDGSYTSELRARIDAGLPALVASVDASTTERGFDHDVTIVAAGVSPSRANLTSQTDFAAHEHARLADELVARLDAAYASRFCSAPSFTVESAAECAYLGAAKAPAAAHAALRTALGGDEPYLASILSR